MTVKRRLKEIAEAERICELQEEAVFSETMRLAIKPACFFAMALPTEKAFKPTIDQC